MKLITTICALTLLIFTSCSVEVGKDDSAEKQKAAMETTQSNIEKAWTNHDIELFKANTNVDVLRISNGQVESRNQTEYLTNMAAFHEAFSELKVNIDKSTIIGNQSFINWTFSGVNTGPFLGNPPTGKQVVTKGFSIWQVNDAGEAIREDVFFDNLGMFQQMGYSMPAPPTTE